MKAVREQSARGGTPTPSMQQSARALQLARRLGVVIGNGSDVGVALDMAGFVMKGGSVYRRP